MTASGQQIKSWQQLIARRAKVFSYKYGIPWPMCGKCKAPVEEMRSFWDGQKRTHTFQACCHGATEEEMDVPHEELHDLWDMTSGIAFRQPDTPPMAVIDKEMRKAMQRLLRRGRPSRPQFSGRQRRRT